jgi:YhcN/YlaJ family sporulation lipoprotein
MAKRILKYFKPIIIFTLAICIAACTSNGSPRTINRGNAKVVYEKGTTRVYRRGGNYSFRTESPGTASAAPAANKSADEERAEKIADAVAGLDAVKSATVVITGNMAIVGIEMDSRHDGTALIDIKRMVEEKAKAVDKGIDHVSVTTAIDMLERIDNMPDAGTDEDLPLAGPDDFVPRG